RDLPPGSAAVRRGGAVPRPTRRPGGRIMKALLVDLDDTLLDYSGGVAESWRQACVEVAAPLGIDTDVLVPAIARSRRWFWDDAGAHPPRASRHDGRLDEDRRARPGRVRRARGSAGRADRRVLRRPSLAAHAALRRSARSAGPPPPAGRAAGAGHQRR